MSRGPPSVRGALSGLSHRSTGAFVKFCKIGLVQHAHKRFLSPVDWLPTASTRQQLWKLWVWLPIFFVGPRRSLHTIWKNNVSNNYGGVCPKEAPSKSCTRTNFLLLSTYGGLQLPLVTCYAQRTSLVKILNPTTGYHISNSCYMLRTCRRISPSLRDILAPHSTAGVGQQNNVVENLNLELS